MGCIRRPHAPVGEAQLESGGLLEVINSLEWWERGRYSNLFVNSGRLPIAFDPTACAF